MPGPTAVLLLAALALAPPTTGALRPNIVVLYADDMGYGDLGAQNPDSRVPTPHLDHLAAQGMRFTDAHSSSGICTPSRYALLTGRYHWRRFHEIVNSFGPSVFDADRLTLPEMLQEQGYRTACIGKWHLGWDWAAIRRPGAEPGPVEGRPGAKAYAPDAFDWARAIPDGPLAHGFDHYFGDDVPNFPPYTWIQDDKVLIAPSVPLQESPKTAEGAWEARPGPMAEGWRLDQVMPTLTRHAVEWIAAQEGREGPFFLYFPFTSPHAPIVPTGEFQGTSQAGGYGDFVVQTDDAVGQVLRALDEHGFAANTLVVFTSDNGPEHYAYARRRDFGHRSQGPLRGLKRDIWEGGHRVPFLVRWPGHVTPGTVSDALISQVDLMGTLAAILERPLSAGTAEDSFDQLPVWTGTGPGPRTTMVHNTDQGRYAVRAGAWLLVDAPTGAVTKVPAWFDELEGYEPPDGEYALYRLDQDLSQHRDLSPGHPDKVPELRAILQEIRATGQVRPLD